jgi:hypothetical protein
MIILEWISEEEGRKVLTAFMWLRIGTSDEFRHIW